MRTVSCGSRSFHSTVATVWNSLPQHFRDITSFNVLKNQINAWSVRGRGEGGAVHVHSVQILNLCSVCFMCYLFLS